MTKAVEEKSGRWKRPGASLGTATVKLRPVGGFIRLLGARAWRCMQLLLHSARTPVAFGWTVLGRHTELTLGLASGVIAVLAALWFTGQLPRPKTHGHIWVESPEVYTRERLVNDRFRQEAWLSAQLPSPSRIELPGLPASTEAKSQDRMTTVT